MTAVLYLDDESTIRRAVHLWLTRHGIEVHTAASVHDARLLCDEHRFVGAFVDVWLEDGSGFDFLAWLQQHHPALAQHVTFVTGDMGTGATLHERLAATGRPAIAKPFDLDDLCRQVAAWRRVGAAAREGRRDEASGA